MYGIQNTDKDTLITPELTAIGSFEKCWKKENTSWWMYKSETLEEMFSEVFICELAKILRFSVAEYRFTGKFVKTKDFTENNKYCLEHMRNFITYDISDSIEEYFNLIYALSKEFAKQYLKIAYMDALCFNVDRHDENLGFLVDSDTGEIVGMAPNYDNNIALLAKECSKNRERTKDFLITEFCNLLKNNKCALELFKEIEIATITKEDIIKIIDKIGIGIDKEFVIDFIINGQRLIEAGYINAIK